MSKKLLFISALVLCLVISGCQVQKTSVTLSSPIEFYSPVMSSVPGFPIEIEVEAGTDGPYEHTFAIKTDNGILLEWGSDMKVRDKGKAFVTKSTTIYWSPFDTELGLAEETKIEIAVTVTADGYNSVTVQNIRIKKEDDGMYYITDWE
ncbi:MAG: hypothetical protein R3232_03595 [Clostridia bacterium]|nr:hypothetical protein [Clostridia bacterium]